MKDEGENISFLEIPEGYLFTPTSIRWKNFFLNNLFWGYSGRTQEEIKMIVLSDGVEQITKKFQFETMNITKYVHELTNIDFSIYLTDSQKSQKILKKQLEKESKDFAIITQGRGEIEEYLATIDAKLHFIKRGYLVGHFEIPVPFPQYDTGYGDPDIVGIKGGFVNELKKDGIVPNGGDESDLLIWTELKEEPVHTNENIETIVCEVKSSGGWNRAFEQLYFRDGDTHKPGYLKSHCFNEGYACFGAKVFADKKQPPAKYDAGSLIFTIGPKPIVFHKDPVSNILSGKRMEESSPSSKRKEASVLVNEKCQSDLIELANKKITRRMMSELAIQKLIPDIINLNINQVINRIGNIRVENVLDMYKCYPIKP